MDADTIKLFIVAAARGMFIGGVILLLMSSLGGCGGSPKPCDLKLAGGSLVCATDVVPQNGLNSLVSLTQASIAQCTSGSGLLVESGLDLDRNGVLNTSEITSLGYLCDGAAGADGADAVLPPDTIVGFIDPCGDHPSHFDEVVLVTADSKLVAYFEQGSKRFLSVLTPGNYITTDNQACHFSVTAEGSVQW